MATKKKTKKDDLDDLDLDLGDLDEMDMTFDDDSLDDPDRSPSKSEVAKELAKDTGKSFAESILAKTAEKALPPQYSANYTEALDLASFAGDIVDRNKQQIDKSMFRFGKEVKKLLPFQVGFLDKYLEKKEEEFAEFKQQSEEEMRNASIGSELSSIFDKQLEIQKAIEAKHSAENKVESKERLVSTKYTLDVLRSIDANAATSAAFETQISKEYFRKSLEIQYKSFFVQADMLRTMREHYKAFAIQFTNIEKNTGLPDFVKLKNTERLSEIMRTNATQAVYKQLFSRNKYMENVKSRINRAVTDKVTSVTDSLGNVTDALGMLNEGGNGSGLRAMATIGASMGGGALGEMAGNRLGGKLQERLKDNKAINSGANFLQAFASSPSTVLRTLRDRMAGKEQTAESDGSTWRAKLYGMARAGLDLTGEERINTDVKKDNYLDHNQPAVFDNRVHRSITEAIPMLLAKILQKNTDLVTMYHAVNQKRTKLPNSEELMYDYRGRKLDTAQGIKNSVEESLFTQKSTKKRTEAIATSVLTTARSQVGRNEGLSKMQKMQLNKTLASKDAKDLLADYYAKAASVQGISLDHDTLVTNAGKNKDLAAIIAQNPKLAQLIQTLQEHGGSDHGYADKGLSDIQNPYPIEALKSLFADASKLTRAKQLNNLTNKSATAIAKALSRYILNRGEDITEGNVKTRVAFSFFQPEEFTKEVQDNITVFVNDVTRISSSGDALMQSSLLSLFSLLNESLKGNFEIDPAVYTTLRGLYPDFVRQKTLTVENLAEGKLDATGKQEFVGFAQIKDATKVSQREVATIRERVFATSGVESILANTRQKSAQFMQGLKDTNGSPTALASFFINEAKSFKSTVSSALNKKYSELQQNFGKISTYVDEVISKGSVAALAGVAKQLADVDTKLGEYITLTQNDLNQRLEQLEKAKEAVAAVTDKTLLQRSAQKELQLLIAVGQRNVKALTTLRQSVQAQARNVADMAQNPVTPSETVQRLGKVIQDVLDATRKQLAELEAAGAQQRLGTA